MTMPRRSRKSDEAAARMDRVLPVLVEGPGEWDRRAENRSDRGRAGSVEEATRALVAADDVETVASEGDEGE